MLVDVVIGNVFSNPMHQLALAKENVAPQLKKVRQVPCPSVDDTFHPSRVARSTRGNLQRGRLRSRVCHAMSVKREGGETGEGEEDTCNSPRSAPRKLRGVGVAHDWFACIYTVLYRPLTHIRSKHAKLKSNYYGT